VAALLGLSQEQKQRIANGSAVFKQLMTPVLSVSETVRKISCGDRHRHLSQEQKQRIAHGSEVFKQLMTPVLSVS
jgi:hypothetical protein